MAERPEGEAPEGMGDAPVGWEAFENRDGIWQGPEKRMGSGTCVGSIQEAC